MYKSIIFLISIFALGASADSDVYYYEIYTDKNVIFNTGPDCLSSNNSDIVLHSKNEILGSEIADPTKFPFHASAVVSHLDIVSTFSCDVVIIGERKALSTLSCFNTTRKVHLKPNSIKWNVNATIITTSPHQENHFCELLRLRKPQNYDFDIVNLEIQTSFNPLTVQKHVLWKGEPKFQGSSVLILHKIGAWQERLGVAFVGSKSTCERIFGRTMKDKQYCAYSVGINCHFRLSNPVLHAGTQKVIGLVSGVSEDGCKVTFVSPVEGF